MKNIFKPETISEFQERIKEIDSNTPPKWGEMNAYQMLRHCVENDRMLLREKEYKRLFIGRLFGKMALKSNIKDDAPLSQNSPTHPELKFQGNGDVEAEKTAWIEMIAKYPSKSKEDYEDFTHPFFGKMNSEQVSRFAYKHIDHHLRQFGV